MVPSIEPFEAGSSAGPRHCNLAAPLGSFRAQLSLAGRTSTSTVTMRVSNPSMANVWPRDLRVGL
jgi:hypothetical protein